MKQWLFLMVLAGAVHAEDFSRYQIILDRSPFGPVGAAVGVDVPQPLQRFQFVALVMSNGGQGPLQAIIHDKDNNRSHFRAQGEKIDGEVEVLSISVDPPKVVLQRGLEKANLGFQPRAAGPALPVAGQPGIPGSAGGAPMTTTVQPGQPPVVRRIPFRRGSN